MEQEIYNLRADVDELKEEMALIKGVNPPKMSKQLIELTTEVKHLKEEVQTLKDTLDSQNITILNLINDQKQLLSNLRDTSTKVPMLPKRISVFPLDSVEQLQDFESKLNDDTLPNYIEAMRLLIGATGLTRSFRCIIGEKLLMEVNLRGLGKKVSLSNYKRFLNALYQASYTGEEWSQDVFLKELQYAIKVNKNRVYKNRYEKNHTEPKEQGQARFEEIYFSEDDDE